MFGFSKITLIGGADAKTCDGRELQEAHEREHVLFHGRLVHVEQPHEPSLAQSLRGGEGWWGPRATAWPARVPGRWYCKHRAPSGAARQMSHQLTAT